MPVDLAVHRLMLRLLELRGHLITFEVKTPTSSTGQIYQIPAVLLEDVKQTRHGHYLLRGLDVSKIHDPERDIEDCRRTYRVDRILSRITDLGKVDSPYLDPHPNAEGFIEFG